MAPVVALIKAIRGIWLAPHRPLFLICYLWAGVTVACWPLADGPAVLDNALQPLSLWHLHELLFGFGGAALGGYMLTALPSWTGGDLTSGWRLKLLVLFWGCARLAIGLAELLPVAVVMALCLAYFACLAGMITAKILIVRAYVKLIFPGFICVLAGLEQAFLYSVLSGDAWAGFVLARLMVLMFCLLMIGVGGRAVPAFSRNWLAAHCRGAVVTDEQGARYLNLALMGSVLAFSALGWQLMMSCACLMLALVLIWKMRGWQSFRVWRSPLLAALHLGYAWLPVGFALLGSMGLVAAFFPHVWLPSGDLLHVFTVGAMAGLIMAISGRAAAHHPDGHMQMTRGCFVGFVLVWLSTWLRVAVAFVSDHGELLINLAAGAWCLGWLAFAIGYLPALRGPVIRPVLSGKRYPKTEIGLS